MRALALFVTALWAGIVAPALADGSRLDTILERHVLRVGTTGDYRPFTGLEKGTGEYSGFDIDMARALAKALGVSIAFAPTTWSGLAQGLAEGDFDIAMGGVSVTLDRQRIGFFSAPYLRDGKTPIARCSDQQKFQTLTDIDRPGVKVIANPGGTNERFDRARLHAADIILYADNLTIFDQLALEFVREHHLELHSFRVMRRMEASLRKASALRLRHSQSLASLRHRPSQAKVRSTIHRLGKTTKRWA